MVVGLLKRWASFYRQCRKLRGTGFIQGPPCGGVTPTAALTGISPGWTGERTHPLPLGLTRDRGHSQKINTRKRVRGLEAPVWKKKKKMTRNQSKVRKSIFFSPYRSIRLKACKGQCCFFKVPPGFTSRVTLGFLHGKHEDPISFPYNSKRSEKQGPFRLESAWL